jgi:hypothetical protein
MTVGVGLPNTPSDANKVVMGPSLQQALDLFQNPFQLTTTTTVNYMTTY